MNIDPSLSASATTLVVQTFLTVVMVVTINTFGSIKKGYVTVDQLLSTTNLGYNLVYRIVSPTVFISLAAIVLYKLGLTALVKNIWVISIYYYSANFILLCLLRRFYLVNKFLYSVIVIFGICLAYFVYNAALRHGMNSILPEVGDFRTELWFIIIAYFYSLLNNFSPNYSVETERKNKFLLKKYAMLRSKYDIFLYSNFKKNEFLHFMFFVIMITEDINRPPFFRLLERMFFFTKRIKTTGIMQVTSKNFLSDKKSIVLAQKIILASYKKHIKESLNESDLAVKIAADYNREGYGVEIINNYFSLKELVNK